MISKIYEYDKELFLKHLDNKWTKYKLLYEYEGSLKEILDKKFIYPVQIGNTYYRWCMRNSMSDEKEGVEKWLMERYWYHPSEDNYTENIHNSVCPVCGYVDYDSWEMNEGEFRCEQCKSLLSLEKRITIGYGDNYCSEMRTTLVKKCYPKKLDITKVKVCEAIDAVSMV